MEESLNFVPMRLLACCLMPNHWNLILHPRGDGDLSRFLQRLTLTHSQGEEEIENIGYAIKESGRMVRRNGLGRRLRNSDWKTRCGAQGARKNYF